MKKLLFILVFAFGVSSQVGAQLLFNFVNLTVGLIQTANEGGYEGQVTLFNYSPCYVHGIRAGWHPGDHFSMGYSIHYSNNTVPNIAKNQFGQSQNFKLYQIETGMYFEYVSNRTANKYWSIPVNLNYGGFFIPDEYVPVNYPGSTSYFSIEPRIQYAFNLTDWFQVHASAGYRLVAAQRLYGANNASLGGPTLNFGIIFGHFK